MLTTPRSHRPFAKNTQNVVKLRSAFDMPDARRRSKLHAQSEIQDADALLDASSSALSSPSLSRTLAVSATAADPFVYSFDRTDSPGRPLTLEVFVKKTTGRETEKLVEREYEVLDANGQAVRGRRARAVLRRGGTESSGDGNGKGEEEEQWGKEEDGFELV